MGPVHALLQADHHIVSYNDGIIDHHAHGDNERSKGYPLKVDSPNRHKDKRPQDGIDEAGNPDDDAGSKPHAENEHNENDCDRFGKVDHE